MEITVTLGEIGQFLLITAAIILLIILCMVARHLLITVKQLNSIFTDVNAVTTIVAEETGKIDETLHGLKGLAMNVTYAKEGAAAIKSAIERIKGSVNVIRSVIPGKRKDKKTEVAS